MQTSYLQFQTEMLKLQSVATSTNSMISYKLKIINYKWQHMDERSYKYLINNESARISGQILGHNVILTMRIVNHNFQFC